ncbi:MAG: DUF5837 family cyanobactin class RiPP [Microcoleaceae cyanobacterium]
MDKKNITPEQSQPINRITNGQCCSELAELSEEILQDEAFAPALEPAGSWAGAFCSFDGDDAE